MSQTHRYFADFDPSDQEKIERITVTLDAANDEEIQAQLCTAPSREVLSFC